MSAYHYRAVLFSHISRELVDICEPMYLLSNTFSLHQELALVIKSKLKFIFSTALSCMCNTPISFVFNNPWLSNLGTPSYFLCCNQLCLIIINRLTIYSPLSLYLSLYLWLIFVLYCMCTTIIITVNIMLHHCNYYVYIWLCHLLEQK